MFLQQKIIKNKLGILNLAEELGNVSKACKIMGVSRDTFYRYRQIVEESGAEGLREAPRSKPNLANRVAPLIEEAVLALAFERPAFGQARVADELKQRGIFVSPATVNNIRRRHGLGKFQERLRVLEKRAAAEGLLLTEDQKEALEKKRDDLKECGEIETEHPGYLGSQDTIYIGHIKGVGRIYQQTFVDTYSKVAICKLYTAKNALMAADHLNDRVLPFFEAQDVPLLRILTDRGSEYCGTADGHPFQLFLGLSEIEHTRTKAYHPQTNGICERFHRTILDELYRVKFRQKVYASLVELQEDLDAWLLEYNERRTHQGKMCCGRTPMATFHDGVAQYRSKRSDLGLTH